MLDTIQRGRFSVSFGLKNETIIEGWWSWDLCVPFDPRWYRRDLGKLYKNKRHPCFTTRHGIFTTRILRYITINLNPVAHCGYHAEEDRQRDVSTKNTFKCLSNMSGYFLCDSPKVIVRNFEVRAVEMARSCCQQLTCSSHIEAELSLSYLSFCEENSISIKSERIMYFASKIGSCFKLIRLDNNKDVYYRKSTQWRIVTTLWMRYNMMKTFYNLKKSYFSVNRTKSLISWSSRLQKVLCQCLQFPLKCREKQLHFSIKWIGWVYKLWQHQRTSNVSWLDRVFSKFGKVHSREFACYQRGSFHAVRAWTCK